jgi:hypothetical protein
MYEEARCWTSAPKSTTSLRNRSAFLSPCPKVKKKQCRKRHLGQWGVGEALENSFPRSTKIVASKTKVFWPVLKSSPAPLQPASQRLPTAKNHRSGSPSHPQEMDEVAHTQDECGAAMDLPTAAQNVCCSHAPRCGRRAWLGRRPRGSPTCRA